MNKIKRLLGILSAAVPLISTTAKPAFALCSPAQTASHLIGDDYYMCGGSGYGGWQCDNNIMSYFWTEFDFDDSWDGRGYDDPCNNSKKLAQTFNALAVLGYAHTSSPNCDFWVEHVATGGLCYAATKINKLRARSTANSGNPFASTGTGLNSRRVTVYDRFFTKTVFSRAGTIYHEARHADGCAHNASDSACPNGTSCDKSWNNGCPAAGNDAGANRYHITFLRAYGVSTRSTGSMRLAALQEANNNLGSRFRDEPCFRFNETTGAAYDSCN